MQSQTPLPIGPATVGLLTKADEEAEAAIVDMSVVDFVQRLFAAIESGKVTEEDVADAAEIMDEDEITFLIGGIIRRKSAPKAIGVFEALCRARSNHASRTTAGPSQPPFVDQWQRRFDKAYEGIEL